MRSRLIGAVLVGLLCVAEPAFAQRNIDPGKKKVVEPRGYLFPYAITIVMVGIGLAAVCRPGGRKWEVDIPEDE